MELHGDDLVIADEENNRIQVCPLVSPRSDCITVGGSGGQGSVDLELDGPRHATVDGDAMHVISDTQNHRVQLRTPPNQTQSCATVVGTGGSGTGLNTPPAVALDSATNAP